jgi:hypothetical protein
VNRRAWLVLLCCGYAAPGTAEQQLTRWTVDGGGGTSGSARYRLTGTIGQPDAIPLLYGGAYRLGGGFWADVQPMIFRDGFEE